MPKFKKMPKTKSQRKYLGPQTVKRITESHIIVSQDQQGKRKEKKIPIHITRPYFKRNVLSSNINQTTKKTDVKIDIVNTTKVSNNIIDISQLTNFVFDYIVKYFN